MKKALGTRRAAKLKQTSAAEERVLGVRADFSLQSSRVQDITKMKQLAPLTAREREVLQLIGRGCSTSEIASALHIMVSTVRKHRENLMRKLDLHTTAEIVLFAVRKGVVSKDD